jgi:hypothetical protein
MKKQLLTIFSLAIFLFSFAAPAFAISTPTFPSCANPQGDVKVTYSDGTHGIVGSTATYTGRDSVYTLSDDTVTQCFCGADGSGIQTNWWKATSLTDDEINILKSEGWVYVPAGNLWGLSDAPYVAKNITYSCLSGGSNNNNNGGNGGGSTSSSSTSSESLDTGIGGGDVLGLAATGDSVLVYGSFLLGIVLLIIGLRRIKKQN